MSTFILRLTADRPDFAMTMSDDEREIMGRHAAHWQPYIESGQMVAFGPVLDDGGSWGLGVLEADEADEAQIRSHAAADPVATTGTGQLAVGRLLVGYVRPRPTS